MERGESFVGLNYVGNSDAMKILGVTNMVLGELIRQGIVKPPHIPRSNGKNIWGAREIFRAFLALHLADEYKTKYGDVHGGYKFKQIRSDILSVERVRGRQFLESDEWAEVAIRAAERGLNLLDLEKVQFNRGLAAKD